MVAKVKNLVALAPVLGAILRPAWMIPNCKCLLVNIFLTIRLSKSLAFCEFASINFKPSIGVVNGRPFLCRSIVWRQICWIDYQTLFEELVSENKCFFFVEKTLMCLVPKIYLFPVLHLLIKYLVTKLWTNRNLIRCCCM